MTAVARLVSQQFRVRILIISSYSELFENNPRIWVNVNYTSLKNWQQQIIRRLLRIFRGGQIENFCLQGFQGQIEKFYRTSGEKLHLVETHSKHFLHTLNYNNMLPEIFFGKNELAQFAQHFQLHDAFAIVQPVGKTSYTINKEWGLNHFQTVINSTPQVTWVQVGLPGDPVLQNVIDMTGKTSLLRELAYILSRAKLVLCLEGLINHLAAAVGAQSIVICSEYLPKELAEYPTSTIITTEENLECAPCCIREPCQIPGKPCTENISEHDVISEVLSKWKPN